MSECCIQCGTEIELETRHEDRVKCKECLNRMNNAKEMYYKR